MTNKEFYEGLLADVPDTFALRDIDRLTNGNFKESTVRTAHLRIPGLVKFPSRKVRGRSFVAKDEFIVWLCQYAEQLAKNNNK